MEDAGFLQELCNIVKQNSDDYDAVIAEKASYPYLYHLSDIRKNLVDWLPITEDMRVLEVRPECGVLTEALLTMAGHVTCIAEDDAHAEVITTRCGSAAVVTQDDWRWKSEPEYDVVLIAGDFYRYRDALGEIKKCLTDSGRLIVADVNRLGLKYWAGCMEEHQNRYFAGLEESAESFSKSEYEAILKGAGFTSVQFYYPYPDYQFPSAIYSDAWLPEKGELADNRRNFDRDRLLLFDERAVFDSLLNEGLFGKMANSFLMIADVKPQEQGVCYEKYSNERRRAFQIRTEIARERDGSRSVRKYALCPEGEHHIASMEEKYRKLSEAYAGSPVDFCPCEVTRDRQTRAEFTFLQGKSLQDSLKAAAEMGQTETLLQEYVRRLRQYGGEEPFHMTPEFAEVFGDAKVNEGLPCAKVSNIDLIFPNLFIDSGREENWEGNWTVIDYEWTFAFLIPKNFLIYRGLYYAYYQVLCRYGASLPELFQAAGLSEAETACYQKMEERFQQYLRKGALPVRGMQRLMGTRVIPVGEHATDGTDGSSAGVLEEAWLPVRSIRYHIDREELQDGSVVCSGWAHARTWDGRTLPVNIRVADAGGHAVPAEITRHDRRDVAEVFKLKRVSTPLWGFDCVWLEKTAQDWQIIFSLGKKEERYTCTNREKEFRM